MSTFLHYVVLFAAKVTDNAVGTAKTIFLQRSRWLLAGIAVVVSDFIYLSVTKSIVMEGSNASIMIVSLASGIGCTIAGIVSEHISKERTFVNVIMSDNIDAMKDLRDYLASLHITNVAADSYTKSWDRKTITITAYPETKAESRLINDYLENSQTKFKRLIQPANEKKGR